MYTYILFFAGRACWSLGNAHSSMGQHLEAYQYAKRHLEISRDTKDRMGQATAQLNLADLCRYVNFLTLSSCFYIPIIFSNLNSNCSNLLYLRNLQEQVKKAFCYQ